MTKEFIIPNQFVCRICRYKLSEVCSPCISDGDFPWFQVRQDLKLEDLPPFPSKDFNNGMPVKIRQVVVSIYMQKIVEKLQEGI